MPHELDPLDGRAGVDAAGDVCECGEPVTRCALIPDDPENPASRLSVVRSCEECYLEEWQHLDRMEEGADVEALLLPPCCGLAPNGEPCSRPASHRDPFLAAWVCDDHRSISSAILLRTVQEIAEMARDARRGGPEAPTFEAIEAVADQALFMTSGRHS